MGSKFQPIAFFSAAACFAVVAIVVLSGQNLFKITGSTSLIRDEKVESAETLPDAIAEDKAEKTSELGQDGEWVAESPEISKKNAETFRGAARSLSRFALFKKVSFPDDILAIWMNSEIGDSIEIPVRPAVTATVKMSRETETGERILIATLDGFGGATLALTSESSGRVRGHILKRGEQKAFKVSREAPGSPVVIESTDAGSIVCVRIEEQTNELGIEPEPFLAPENPESEPNAAAAIPDLNSKPGAARVIYLDFDGEVVRNTWWNNGARIDAQPYARQQNISGIWKAIAEDFAPFDVNVTTNRAVFDNAASNRRCMVIFTPTNDAAPGAGGVAYLNTFGDPVTYMCWVFNSGLNGAAEAGSHEAGHQLGLRHDGTTSQSYYSGHRHSETGISWGPIMGASYSRDITQWSNGGYNNADNFENDLNLISSYIPIRGDDHGNSRFSATSVSDDGSGTISENGIIERSSDVDYFQIQTGSVGEISVTASPDSGYRNLDIRLQILDSSGQVLAAQSPSGNFEATATVGSAPAGTYFLTVEGVGLGANGFSENGYNDYGSIGTFSLSGQIPVGTAPAAPTGVSASDGVSLSSIFLQWNSVEGADSYEIYRSETTSPGQGSLLGTSDTTLFVDSTPVAGRIYYYTVRSKNENGLSGHSAADTGYSGTIELEAPAGVTASDGTSTEHVRVSWLEAAYAASYFIYRNTSDTAGGFLLGSTSELFYLDTTATAGTTYYYSVQSRDGLNISNFSARDAGSRAETVPLPVAPENVVASKGEFENYVVVRWDPSENAEFYRIYRGETADPNASSISPNGQGVSDTVFYDTSAQEGRTYFYFVQAVNSAGTSPFGGGDFGFRAFSTTADDAYENNDSRANAYDLGSGDERWLRTIGGYARAGNDDWYRIRLAPGESRVEAIVMFPASSGEIDLELYDEDGNFLSESTGNGANELFAFETGNPGATLFFRILPRTTPAGAYDLKWKSLPTGRIGNLADESIGMSPTALAGVDTFDPAGGAQAVFSKKKKRRRHTAFFAVENEAAVSGPVATYGTKSTRKFRVKYKTLAGGNVTAQIATGSAANYAPLQEVHYRVTAKPTRKARKKARTAIVIGSHIPGVTATTDSARFHVLKKKSRR